MSDSVATLRPISAAGSDTPVELRTPDATLIAETTVGGLMAGQVRVPAEGDYLASVRLPNGSQVTHTIRIGHDGVPDPSAVASLLPPPVLPAKPAPMGIAGGTVLPLHPPPGGDVFTFSYAVRGYLGTPTGGGFSTGTAGADAAPMGLKAVPNLGGWGVQSWIGTAVGKDEASLTSAVVDATAADNTLHVSTDRHERRSTTLHLTPPTGDAMNYVLPPGTTITLPPAGPASFDVGDALMNNILQQRMSGRLVTLLVQTGVDASFMGTCIELDEIGAALAGGYLALRALAEDARDATIEAMEPIAGMSDTMVIRAELAARCGRHADALCLFLQAGACDIPSFTSGLGFLVDRLRLYARLGETEANRSKLPADGSQRALNCLAAVQPFALLSDFAAPFVTYRGRVAPGVAAPEGAGAAISNQ